MKRARWVAVLSLVLAAGRGGGGAPPTTPTTPPTAGGGPDGRVVAQRQGFEAGGGSGIVASRRYPGVLWAIRDRGAQDRPGKPDDTALLKVPEPDPAEPGPARLLATYRYRFPRLDPRPS
jgi:hypothetical protein